MIFNCFIAPNRWGLTLLGGLAFFAFLSPAPARAACDNGGKCNPSDKPNKSDRQQWCTDRDAISLSQKSLTDEACNVDVKVTVDYVLTPAPECSNRQPNWLPYTPGKGVELYLTAQKKESIVPEEDLGEYRVTSKGRNDKDKTAQELEKSLGEIFLGPIHLYPNPAITEIRDSHSFTNNKPNGEKLPIDVKAAIEKARSQNQRLRWDVVLKNSTDNRTTGRGRFPGPQCGLPTQGEIH